MAEQREVFKLMAKLSSVDRDINSNAQEAYERVFSYVNNELTKIMEDSSFTQKSNLRAQLDSALANVQLFLRYPFLYGKTSIGIIAGKSQEGISFIRRLQRLQSSQTFVACDRQRSLPYVIYDDSLSNRISVTNHADNIIYLTVKEYLLMSNLYKENINIHDLVKSLAFSASLHHKYINYVVLPRYADTSSSEFGNLAALCKCIFIIHEDSLDYKKLPLAVGNHSGPLYVVAAPESASAQNAIKVLSTDYPGRKVQLVSLKDAISICSASNRPQNNFIFYEKVLSLLLQLQAHQATTIKKHTKNIELLGGGAVSADDVRTTMETLRQKEIERRDYEDKMQKQIDGGIQNVRELATKFEKALIYNIPNEMLDMLTNSDVDYASDFAEIEGQIVLLALKCGNQELAGRYVEKLEAQNHPIAYIYRLYYCKLAHVDYPMTAITKLKNDTSNRSAVLRAKIHFYEALQISPEERDELASKLATRDPEELYYAACHIERTEGKESARSCYIAAFDAGYASAGERLVEYFLSDGATYSFTMKRLADALVPKAAFEYGKACLNNNRYAQGITYLRISAALKYTPAVLFYSDHVYRKALLDKNRNDIKTAISLYRFISMHNNSLKQISVTAKLGVLYYLQDDFVHAKQFFDTDCSLPEAKFCLGSIYYYGKGISPNWGIAKKYLSEAEQQGNHEAGLLLRSLQTQEEKAQRVSRKEPESGKETSYSSYDKEADYNSTSKPVSTSDDGCFITTATCRSECRPDNCEELTAFRKYRDETLSLTDEGKALIAEYYRIAPSIVERISEEDNSEEIYSFLYSEYILPGYELLQQGRGEEAKKLYAKGIIMLANKYGIALTATIPIETIN